MSILCLLFSAPGANVVSVFTHDHQPYSVLDALHPLAHVFASVYPLHHSPTVSLIVVEVSNVLVTSLPDKLTLALLNIIAIIAFELIELLRLLWVRWKLLPLSFTVLHPFEEFTNVSVSIVPLILAIPFRVS